MPSDKPSSPLYHRRIRLAPESYTALDAISSITIAVQGRRPIFADERIAAAAVDVLRSRASLTAVLVYAHCVMPDHVHLVIRPSATCSIITFVGEFKNLTQRAAWSFGVRGSFWQKSFWDHFLRADEQLERVVTYVLDNPVRRGMVERREDYPFAGSLEIDV